MTGQVAATGALAHVREHPWRPRLIVLLFATVPLALFLALHLRLAAPFADMTRDIAAVADVPWWSGFLSSVGAFYWICAAAICLYSATMLASRCSGRDAGFLFASGLGLALLGLDDFFMFHESIAPNIGISERIVAGGYLVGIVCYVVAYRGRFRGAWRFWGLAGIAALAASLAIDQFTGNGPIGTVVEDLFKWTGIAAICILLVRVSFTLATSPALTPIEAQPTRRS